MIKPVQPQSSRRLLSRLFVLIAMLWVFLPSASYALDVDGCAYTYGGFSAGPGDYSQKAVACLRGLIETASYTLMNELSDFMRPTMIAITVLVISFYGIRVIGGAHGGMRGAAGVLVRIGLTLFYSYNMGGLAQATFDLTDELIQVTSNFYPWATFDRVVGQLMGLGWDNPAIANASGSAMSQGLVGLLSASAFSSTVGIFLALVGAVCILELLFLIFRCMYCYISAITVIAVMIMVSPLVIPMAIFVSQERYVKAWYGVIISAMLTPTLLFALMSIFMGIFFGTNGASDNGLVPQIFKVLATASGGGAAAAGTYKAQNADYHVLQKVNQPLYEWMIPTDPQYLKNLQYSTKAFYTNTPGAAFPHHIDPTKFSAVSASVRVPTVDFGSDAIGVMGKLIFYFLEMLVLIYLLKALIEQVPRVATDIAQAVPYINTGETALESKIKGSSGGSQGAKDFASNLSERVRMNKNMSSQSNS